MTREQKEQIALMTDSDLVNPVKLHEVLNLSGIKRKPQHYVTELIPEVRRIRALVREELLRAPAVIHNNTTFSLEEVRKFKRYGSFMNEWRRRLVDVYEHPSDPARLVTVGANHQTNTYWICDEPYTDYKRRIENADWSTYK
jgi:hypothetical protein